MDSFTIGNKDMYARTVADNLSNNPPNKRIPQQLWDMEDKLLLEKIPIAGISRVTEISEPWLFGLALDSDSREIVRDACWESRSCRC